MTAHRPTPNGTARRDRRALALALGAALVGVGCAGGAEGSAPATGTPTPPASTTALSPSTMRATEAPTTTLGRTTTTAAGAPRATTTVAPRRTTTTAPATTAPATTTTIAAGIARIPLTGQPLAYGQLAPDRPAMVVKIDNVGRGRPQSGLNQADIVFEEIVEGRATRFAAVFHSQGANPVGPIRSGRTQDVDLLSGLNQPLFVWSGGNPGVEAAIENSDFVSLSHTGRPPAGGFFRTGRPQPHNLYNNTDFLWGQLTWATGRPAGLFDYLEPDEEPRGELRSWAQLRVGANTVRWEWDPATRSYLRAQNGAPHQLTEGRASANTVVILVTGYRPSYVDARSPEAITVGSGIAFVLTGGHYQVGVWRRSSNRAPIDLHTPAGEPLEIVPGRTWVELADAIDHATATG